MMDITTLKHSSNVKADLKNLDAQVSNQLFYGYCIRLKFLFNHLSG